MRSARGWVAVRRAQRLTGLGALGNKQDTWNKGKRVLDQEIQKKRGYVRARGEGARGRGHMSDAARMSPISNDIPSACRRKQCKGDVEGGGLG